MITKEKYWRDRKKSTLYIELLSKHESVYALHRETNDGFINIWYPKT